MAKALTIIEALESMRKDGIPTVVIPLFLTTNRAKYIKEVIHRCKQVLKGTEYTRIYLMMEEGVSERRAKRIWEDVQRKGSTLENVDNVDRLQVYSFGNVPTDILIMLFEDKKINIEIV